VVRGKVNLARKLVTLEACNGKSLTSNNASSNVCIETCVHDF